MSSELLTRNKVNADADLLAAKEEAREKMRSLSDNDLAQVAGGRDHSSKSYFCSTCNQYVTPAPVGSGMGCPYCKKLLGDTREGMNEALADIDGLMCDMDGWD